MPARRSGQQDQPWLHEAGGSHRRPGDQRLERKRLEQPRLRDRKTGEKVHLVFAFRLHAIETGYINRSIIPSLCRKAGVPTSDARGRITSHRARHTIASQLFNAKDRMTLFELQEWLGHRTPVSTQHHIKITQTQLARAYADAGYFARNMRTMEVLVDRAAVEDGSAASGKPRQCFDLGHGYCTYSFRAVPALDGVPLTATSTCQKTRRGLSSWKPRQTCSGCTSRFLSTGDERAAVEDGQIAVDRLLERLADVPTPSGPSPRMLKQLPVLQSLNQRQVLRE